MTLPPQLVLDLPVRPSLARGDFIVSSANAAALGLVERWPDWPRRRLLLVGPEASGKTHLAHLWAERSGAVILPATMLGGCDPLADGLAPAPTVIEDLDAIAGQRPAEERLFHLVNAWDAAGAGLLLTARQAPPALAIGLPDLQSRIESFARTRLALPDDTLLAALLNKHFADRQIAPSPETIRYLVRRIDRSFAAARTVAAALDRLALAEKAAPSRHLAARLLDSGDGQR